MEDQIPMIESEIDMQMTVWVLPFSVARIFPQSLIFEFFNWKVWKVIGKSLHLGNTKVHSYVEHDWRLQSKSARLKTLRLNDKAETEDF